MSQSQCSPVTSVFILYYQLFSCGNDPVCDNHLDKSIIAYNCLAFNLLNAQIVFEEFSLEYI